MTADARRDDDYRAEGRVTAVDGAGEDILATVRIEDQVGARKDGARDYISARFVEARPVRRLKENGVEVHVGDFAVVLVPLEPRKRTCALIHVGRGSRR